MSHHWLLLTFTWFGPVSLQYINTAGPSELTDSSSHYPLPNAYYFNQPSNLETFQNNGQNDYFQESLRKRRTAEDKDSKAWHPNVIGNDKTLYIKNEEALSPYIILNDDNKTDIDKKNFSPWGGKRDGGATFEHMWSWKRSSAIREPSMPKRVRFSPWGGKRNGQVIFKPGSKGSKIIFASSIPELTRIVSNFSPGVKRFNLAGIHIAPGFSKRNPIKILAMSTSVDAKTLRDALPFSEHMEQAPQYFKPGHPYNDVNLKKDGKRKMKFSIWGGKRAPPIIGPIWTPSNKDGQDTNLGTILLLRNKQQRGDLTQE